MHIFDINSQPSSYSSLSKVPSLQTIGSPQGKGFPSTSGKNSGTFWAALRGALRELLYHILWLKVPLGGNMVEGRSKWPVIYLDTVNFLLDWNKLSIIFCRMRFNSHVLVPLPPLICHVYANPLPDFLYNSIYGSSLIDYSFVKSIVKCVYAFIFIIS